MLFSLSLLLLTGPKYRAVLSKFPPFGAGDQGRFGRRLGPRMGLVVDLFKVFGGHVRISLGGHEISVAQKLLDRSQVAAPGEEVGGKGMAKGVRAHLLANRSL